jgi:predicted nucleic acid-binding protein
MYLLDTNVISEIRKGARANHGVQQFFQQAHEHSTPLYLSVVTVGELRRGVEQIRHRNDIQQADQLEEWLNTILPAMGSVARAPP